MGGFGGAKLYRKLARTVRGEKRSRADDAAFAARQRNAQAADDRARLQRLAQQMRERIDGVQARG